MNLHEYISGVKSGSIDPRQTIVQHLEKAKAAQSKYNTFINFADEYIENNIDQLAKKGPLYGAPIAVKDLILTQGVATTFGSLMSETFIPSYSATCFRKLEEAGACLLGKTNLDEHAMGTTNESSAYGPVINPVGE